MARVRITKKVPKALSGLEMKMSAGLYGKGTNGNSQFRKNGHLEAGKISQQPTEVRDTLQPVSREDANLEAEKGETAMVNIDGIPAHFKIGGKRHSKGGTPLNLPDNSFIFSDTAKMVIKDPILIAQFGMVPKKSGYTPAEIAKKYDINKYRQLLADSNTDTIDTKTAEMMISNYNMKLAKLALIQESMKGFPQGIPVVAMPYISEMNMNPEEFTTTQGQQEEPDADMGVSKYGGGLYKAQKGVTKTPGFGDSFNTQPEEKFAKNYPGIYNAYRKALDSKKPDEMFKAANLIESQQTLQTPLYSLDMIPGTDADMFENLSETLRETATKQYNSESYKKHSQSTINKFKDAPVKAQVIYNNLQKEYDAIPNDDYVNKLNKSTQIKQFEKLLRSNKGKYLPSTVKEPWQIYTQDDLNIINTMYNEVGKQSAEPVTSVLQPAKSKTSDIKASLENRNLKDWTNPTEAEIDSLTDAEAEYLERIYTNKHMNGYAYGGSFQDGGAKGRLKSKLKGTTTTPDATTSTTKPTATTTTAPVNEYDPYGGLTEQELADLLSEETPLRKSKVSGKQTAGAEGTYGTDVSLEDFIKRNPEYAKSFEAKHGRKFNPKTDAETFQNEYSDHVEKLAYDRALKAGYADAEAKSLAKKFKETQGFQKEVKAGDPRGIDKKFGEYTSSRFEPIFKSVKKPEAEVKEPEAETKRAALEQNTPIPYTEGRNAPWWLQDIVKTYGAVADKARIKKYNPWQATPQVRLPEATFYDPTRELAANTEMANMAMQNSAAFSNPQQQAAANSVAQGQMAKAAADTMGKYNNLNVGVANQLSEQQTGILNQASQNKANLDTQLFDKYTIANQQFDNSKAQARQQIRQSYIDAITNRANTANLNSMYPQYAVDPSRGGFTYFKNPKALDPTKDRTDFESQYARALKITGDPDRALKYMHLQATGKLGTNADIGPTGYQAGE